MVFIGQNGGYEGLDDLVSQQRAVIDRQVKKEEYIVLGLTSGTREERAEMEERMQEEYADKYVNLREYLSGEGLKESGVKKTEEDEEYISQGKVPPSLLADTVHLNKKGYALIGNVVFERMKSLGYFEA